VEPWCADCSKRTALIEPGGWGAMVLTTTGRRTGRARPVIVGYLEDGQSLITLAMNGWGEAEPAWWLNLQAHPDTSRHTPMPRPASSTDPARSPPGRRKTTSASTFGPDSGP
jgi:deazaflavin-dependent oxidoreductase (nitroreductase family)